jgi:hypothetical protein
MRIIPLDRPHVVPYLMPPRFKTEIVWFMTPPGEPGVPQLGPDEYFVRLEDSRRFLDTLLVEIVSPLSEERKTEIELSEDHEGWLKWMVEHEIQHVKLESIT